ncbi:hypothetical protein AJ78_06597 [Emergomyces pasteurianus Ep9510]|uniref:Uncharacterized protein n=1 Tax=Emergomyces pasteurianus Ep9510 TaxID=1447872 RepID=A0A1J9PAA7_9EURO|nr:hypothetical protein AJ78_06597 [Emergomyces pasteurianus Ep9510]
MSSSSKRPEVFRYANFNVSALCSLATQLRNGSLCDCDLSQVPAGGSLNWAISILFIDGVEWVLRSPREDGAVQCHETNSTLLASEAATLKYIRANSTIPVPQVFAYSASRDNEIGVPYILMSKASGFPLSCRWEIMTYKEKAKILDQLGAITWQLSRLRFSHIGSLYEDETGLHVKSCLSRGLLTHARHSLKHLNRGPFPVVADYFNALLSAFSEHAKYLPLRPHCLFAPVPLQSEYIDFPQYKGACDRWNDFVILGAKIDSSANRLDYTIAGDLLSKILPEWLADIPDLHGGTPDSFPLHHPDINVNNIFVDDKYQITCLIDWAFSSTVPSSVLLTVPGLPQSRDELDQPLAAAFEKGLKRVAYDALRPEELHEYHRLCQILQCSRLMWLFSRLLCFDSIADFKLFREIWRVMDPHRNLRQEFRLRQSFFNYRQLYEEIRQEDRTAEQISCDEKNYFKNRSQLELSIARKLTLVSDWSSRYGKPPSSRIRVNGDVFVADKRLWLWIDTWLENLQRRADTSLLHVPHSTSSDEYIPH